MRRARALAALLASACHGGATAGASAPPPDPAPRVTADADSASEPVPVVARAQYSNRAEPALAERIERHFGGICRFKASCGELVAVDCGSVTDGPLYFARRDSLEIVSRCGGYCMNGPCTDCPPEEWRLCREAAQ